VIKIKLKVKFLKLSAGIPVVMLNRKIAEKMGVHVRERVLIETVSKNKKKILSVVDLIGGVRKNEILVSFEIKERLGLRKGQFVEVVLGAAPKSLVFIKKKLDNHELKKSEIKKIISEVVNNSLSEAEIALFISAMYKNGMSFKETVFLIESILETGNKLNLKNKFIADKHCIGGVAGNRTTPIVVSICAAAGVVFPKTSSRAITSAAGTADVIETIANIDFSMDELRKIIHKTNASLAWGGGIGMVPADSKIIKIEKMLKIDPKAQLLASIMAKKLAMGSKYILIDIPFGKGAKVSKKGALELKKQFERLGKHFKLKLRVVLTDGSQPIGNGIGPALELIDVARVLDPEKKGPQDLDDKSLFLAGQIFEMVGKAKKGKGMVLAREILDSGKAFKKFNEIIDAQGRKIKRIHLSEYKKDIFCKKSGKIVEMDNKKINNFGRVAGCPVDKFAGLYLYKHVGDEVYKKDKLLTIYAESKSRLRQAVKFYKSSGAIVVR